MVVVVVVMRAATEEETAIGELEWSSARSGGVKLYQRRMTALLFCRMENERNAARTYIDNKLVVDSQPLNFEFVVNVSAGYVALISLPAK